MPGRESGQYERRKQHRAFILPPSSFILNKKAAELTQAARDCDRFFRGLSSNKSRRPLFQKS